MDESASERLGQKGNNLFGKFSYFCMKACCGYHYIEEPSWEKSICCGYSFELQVDAIQMGTHNICLCKEIDKMYTGCNLKTTEFLDCALIRVCVVIWLNTVVQGLNGWDCIRKTWPKGLKSVWESFLIFAWKHVLVIITYEGHAKSFVTGFGLLQCYTFIINLQSIPPLLKHIFVTFLPSREKQKNSVLLVSVGDADK